MSLPKIYLNQAKFNNQELIRILFKQNDSINGIIKKNDWINFHAGLKSYCVKNTEQNINLIKDLFEGVALVNTYYLTASPKIKADEIIINKAISFNQVLPHAEKTDFVFLIPNKIADKDVILLKVKLNKELNKRLKEKDYLRWDNDLKMFYFPATKSFLNKFIRDFSNSLNLSLHQKFKINDVGIKKLLLEQKFEKGTGYKSCPTNYLEAMFFENKSINTIKTYHYYLLRYINTFKNCSLERINSFSEEKINEYHIAMQQSKLYSESSLNQSVNAIKYYYNYVLKRNIRYDGINRPRRNRKLPNFYSKEEITKIIKATPNLKHRAMIMLLFSSGLRISELLDLKPKDILSDVMQLHVKQAKGRKDRYTLLSVKTLEVLRTYFKEYKPTDYLFEGQYGGKYSATSLRKVLFRSIERAGVTNKGSLHVLRHTFATHLLEAGVDIRYIQELLGHNSSKTTEIYTHVTNKHLQQIKSPLDDLDV